MSNEIVAGVDLALVQRRFNLMAEACNKGVAEILQTGRLRVTVDQAFTGKPDDLLRLIGLVCLLKQYATAAAVNHGQHMGLSEWQGFFNEFDRGTHVLPNGKLS
jgi:hypothetical protein